MNNIRKYTTWLGAGAILITLATGCADNNDNGQPDSLATTNEVANSTATGVEATGNVASNMAGGAENVAAAAGNNLAETGSAIVGAGDAAIYTPKIKTALGTVAALQGSKIDVDTLADKKEIVLRGTVTSAAQKTLAEATAKKNAPADYAIVNQLTMAGKM